MRNGFLKGPPSPFFFSRGDVKREKRRRGRRKGKKNPPPGGFPQVTQQRKREDVKDGRKMQFLVLLPLLLLDLV